MPEKGDSDKGEIDARGFVHKLVGDISKADATKQMLLGVSTGWLTGKVAIKAGKVVALLAGSSIIILQIANHTGYVQVNWEKLFKNPKKAMDKLEEEALGAVGHAPGWTEKVERFVDRNLDKVEEKIDKLQNKSTAKRWYSRFVGKDKIYKLDDINTFLVSFAAGVALGFGTS